MSVNGYLTHVDKWALGGLLPGYEKPFWGAREPERYFLEAATIPTRYIGAAARGATQGIGKGLTSGLGVTGTIALVGGAALVGYLLLK